MARRPRAAQRPRLVSPDSPWRRAPSARLAGKPRVLNVPQDPYDLRDRLYDPVLSPLPEEIDGRPLAREAGVLDQGTEGACTGFAMAAVVNFLFRTRGRPFRASPRFLYENAKRYDEWKGDDYEGSSIRGAMKGFLKHGACSEQALPYVPDARVARLPEAALKDAAERPLGAYFRVSTSSVNDMQSALHEAGVVLASAQVHRGWDAPERARGALAQIRFDARAKPSGGHAFVLVGYTRDGFVVQNSWGAGWGSDGFALLGYGDWLANRMDAWVAQLGLGSVGHANPRALPPPGEAARARVSETEIAGHYLAIRNGDYARCGEFRSFPEDVRALVETLRAQRARWHGATSARPLKVLVYAHGGLVSEDSAAKKALDLRRLLLPEKVFSLALLWHTSFLEEVLDVLRAKHARVRPVETPREQRVAGWLREKLEDAIDDALELALRSPGGALWREMKADAALACRRADGRPGPVLDLLDAIRASGVPVELHLAAHSAGSILVCRLFEWLAAKDVRSKTTTFLAPSVTTRLFRETLVANERQAGRFALHLMSDEDERSDRCAPLPGTDAGHYHKSLLYLVSQSFEEEDSRALLGLARNVSADWRGGTADVDVAARRWIGERGELIVRRPEASSALASLHGSFDDDATTLEALVRRVRG